MCIGMHKRRKIYSVRHISNLIYVRFYIRVFSIVWGYPPFPPLGEGSLSFFFDLDKWVWYRGGFAFVTLPPFPLWRRSSTLPSILGSEQETKNDASSVTGTIPNDEKEERKKERNNPRDPLKMYYFYKSVTVIVVRVNIFV